MSYTLTWYKGRNTPAVTKPGQSRKKKQGEGAIVKQRQANSSEVAKLNRGDWLRVDKHGRTPGGSGGYGTGSSVRPQFNKNYRKASSAYAKGK